MNLEERILILAPLGKDAELTAKVLRAAGLFSHACRDPEDLLREIGQGACALLLVEEALSPALLGPLSRHVAGQPSWSDLPVILLSSAGAESPRLSNPVQVLGNITVLERPVRTLALISAAGSALRARKRQYGLREADRRKDEFLASLGHELRNPLAPIRSSVDVIKRLYPDSAQVKNVAAIVERQVTHLSRLVDDLLDVARITRGKVVLQRAPTTLAAVVRQAVEMCATQAAAAGHAVDVALPDEEVPLTADRVRLVQCVGNLIANAIKFTPRGGRIAISAAAEGDRAVIRVRDTGIGLDPRNLTRIFELFEQADAVGGQIKGGLGIGLSLARQFVEMHGGNIRADSDGAGHGSEFVITLPLVQAARASGLRQQPGGPPDVLPARPASGVRPAPAAPDVEGQRTRVLVVDDNHDAADMLALLFRGHGFSAICAYDGQEAIEEAQRFDPEVVVMDLGMPGMDGFEAARRMRETPRRGDAVMIALTGWGQEGTRKKALEAGFDFHVVKPVDIEVLKGYIAQS